MTIIIGKMVLGGEDLPESKKRVIFVLTIMDRSEGSMGLIE